MGKLARINAEIMRKYEEGEERDTYNLRRASEQVLRTGRMQTVNVDGKKVVVSKCNDEFNLHGYLSYFWDTPNGKKRGAMMSIDEIKTIIKTITEPIDGMEDLLDIEEIPRSMLYSFRK